MAVFNVGDKVTYNNIAGRHNGVGVITDLVGQSAKIFYDKDKPEANTKSSFYTYANVKLLTHYKEDK